MLLLSPHLCLSRFSGTFTGPVVRFISDIRKKHGHDAVSLKGCGRFDLADDLSDIADIAHIDLSSIDSLQGGCGHLFPSSLIRPRVCLHRYPRTLFRQLSLGQSPHKSFREKSYVTLLFVELPPDFTQLPFFVQVTSLFSSTRPMATVIDVRDTGVTGKFLSDRSFR